MAGIYSATSAASTAPSFEASGSASTCFETATRSCSARPASPSRSESAQDALLQKVTIAPAAAESLIRQKIQAPPAAREFLPEREIADVEALRRDYEKLRLAHELGRSIGLEVNLELLLEQIIMKAFELIPADRGVILLMEEGVPRPKIAKTRDGKNEQIVLSNSILNEVVTNKASVLSSDATMDSRFSAAHSVIMQGIRSTMTVPLLHHDELLGIMHLDSMIATNAFTEKDLQIFGGIASQAAVAIHNSQLARKIEHEAKTRAQFQRLLSPNLVDQIVQGRLQLEKGGALSEVTMLFSDIRGFTSMSESRAPQEIVRMLNEYFELMVDVIFKYEGTLDKFVGDEVIALFGAPVSMQQAEVKAVQCALDMMRVLSEWNRTRAAEGQNEIKIGIGINTGTGGHGRDRQLARAPVHRHRRRREYRVPALQRRAAGADHLVRGDLSQGAGRGGGGSAGAGARQRQGRGAARLQRRRATRPRTTAAKLPVRGRTMRAFVSGLALLLAGHFGRRGDPHRPARAHEDAGARRDLASERSAFLAGGGALAVLVLLMACAAPSPFLAALAGAAGGRRPSSLGAVPLIQARQLAAARGVSARLRTLSARPHRHRGPGAAGPNGELRHLRGAALGRRAPRLACAGQSNADARRLPAAHASRDAQPPDLVVHGGFWSAGKKGEAALASRRLADRGFTVFDVDYRLAPQPNWQLRSVT